MNLSEKGRVKSEESKCIEGGRTENSSIFNLQSSITPKISVITVTFNAESCLQRTLDSVLAQTYPCVEHWIVDGQSTDGTVAMAERYKKLSAETAGCHTVNIQSRPDEGLYDAMNKGLMLATGDYIVYMNAGDFFHSPDTLATIARCAGENNLPAVIYGDTDIVDNDGRYIGRRHLLPPEHLTWRSFRWGMLVCHQAFYVRTDIARRRPYNTNYWHSADVDWCIRVMRYAEKMDEAIVNAHATVACYTREGQTTRFRRASLMERFAVMRFHYGLPVTATMHLWFVFRAAWRKLMHSPLFCHEMRR